ncbi:uncharacterized protein LOC117651553 [Thrips palmi]|uniref:Uncharacterized protein LOC117651553 n=1 Tax=Thrips palmi TaxID=161013 RepID=A0A6P9A277_THRPL|nr:uncharacterized protein LOC117651553 [Thrips palmi]XP_034251547.1 uncharacterized protein LOC117651553 [Thrips palmi]XP_034251548.1 uncharacterized protein LOC117651553 [Thrips palmi]XP_034251549.1 uncharacterized protein LOC117651553 [Thrips palmi]XP_034251550.1 uncharacterized protein LOC117651553 [Thrips palmi]XP_034251551.1 uncharacterized protein LOC117651553 [Thrips palmi]
MTARRPGALLVVVLCALLVPLTTSSAPDSPSCRFRTMNTTWEECHHFKLSHYCCSGAVHFEEGEVNATTVVNVQGSTRTARTANITFSAATDVGSSFLLRLARGCSAYTECFDVAVAAFGDVEVELAFVPADAPYKVTRLDNVKFQDWLSLTTTNGSAETSFLHDSGILLDILGSE